MYMFHKLFLFVFIHVNFLCSCSVSSQWLKVLVKGLEECFTATYHHHHMIAMGSTWEFLTRSLKLGVSNSQETRVWLWLLVLVCFAVLLKGIETAVPTVALILFPNVAYCPTRSIMLYAF